MIRSGILLALNLIMTHSLVLIWIMSRLYLENQLSLYKKVVKDNIKTHISLACAGNSTFGCGAWDFPLQNLMKESNTYD